MHSIVTTDAAQADINQLPDLIRGDRRKPLNGYWKQMNQKRSSVRAMGEHASHVVKRLWGFSKVR